MEIEILRRNTDDPTTQKQILKLFNQLNYNPKQISLQGILESTNNILFVICREDKNIIGMASMITYRVLSGHKGMIEDVVVDAARRGKGIGRKLMERLMAEGKDLALDEILLFSGHHRTPAIKLYTSLGFRLKDSGLYRLELQ